MENTIKDSFKKRIERSFARYAFFTLRWVMSRLPLPVFKAVSFIFIAMGNVFISKKKKIAMESLRTAFANEKSEEEIKEIAQACFNNFGQGMIDLLYFLDRPQRTVDKVSIEGSKHIDDALLKGKGAIIVSAHFGDFILMYIRMIEAGYKVNVIMRRTRDEEFEKHISEFRVERGIKTIYDLPQRKCIHQSLKALRNNELLFILLDQNFGGDSRVFVKFFGQMAATAAGPVIFSARTSSPIIPMFILREGEDRHRIVIEEPISLDEKEDTKEFLTHNVSKISKVLERYIREYPHLWGGWMHKRWKSRTLEEQAIIDKFKKNGLEMDDYHREKLEELRYGR